MKQLAKWATKFTENRS